MNNVSNDKKPSRRCVATFKALGDETRQGILVLLSRKPRSVNEIVARFDLTQPTISRHLSVLRQAGLVTATRSRQRMIYELQHGSVHECCNEYLSRFGDGCAQAPA
jgi:DNA-binding transcriptional ArsR family regulator